MMKAGEQGALGEKNKPKQKQFYRLLSCSQNTFLHGIRIFLNFKKNVPTDEKINSRHQTLVCIKRLVKRKALGLPPKKKH